MREMAWRRIEKRMSLDWNVIVEGMWSDSLEKRNGIVSDWCSVKLVNGFSSSNSIIFRERKKKKKKMFAFAFA